MYYDEQIINGVLCHRGTPDGKWIPFSVEALTEKLARLKQIEQVALMAKDELQCAAYESPYPMSRKSYREVSKKLAALLNEGTQ